MNKTKEIVLASLFIAAGLIIPMIFHSFSLGGPTFLPMHLPVLLAGMIFSPATALLVGILTPVLSSIFTGMPAIYPILPIMVSELGVYGFAAAVCRKKYNFNPLLSLIIAMILGKFVAGLVVAILAFTFGLNMNPINYVVGAIVTGIPGIIIQLIFLPVLTKLIEIWGLNSQHIN